MTRDESFGQAGFGGQVNPVERLKQYLDSGKAEPRSLAIQLAQYVLLLFGILIPLAFVYLRTSGRWGVEETRVGEELTVRSAGLWAAVMVISGALCFIAG